MANVKYCKSTRRVADLELYPDGAQHPMNVRVYDVRFHDTGEECYARTEELARFFCSDFDFMLNVLRFFGLEWRDSCGWDDALEMLAQDYERRKESLRDVASFER